MKKTKKEKRLEGWIKQQIDLGLGGGKTPYKLSIELPKRIKELFGVEVTEAEITRRAARVEQHHPVDFTGKPLWKLRQEKAKKANRYRKTTCEGCTDECRAVKELQRLYGIGEYEDKGKGQYYVRDKGVSVSKVGVLNIERYAEKKFGKGQYWRIKPYCIEHMLPPSEPSKFQIKNHKQLDITPQRVTNGGEIEPSTRQDADILLIDGVMDLNYDAHKVPTQEELIIGKESGPDALELLQEEQRHFKEVCLLVR